MLFAIGRKSPPSELACPDALELSIGFSPERAYD